MTSPPVIAGPEKKGLFPGAYKAPSSGLLFFTLMYLQDESCEGEIKIKSDRVQPEEYVWKDHISLFAGGY